MKSFCWKCKELPQAFKNNPPSKCQASAVSPFLPILNCPHMTQSITPFSVCIKLWTVQGSTSASCWGKKQGVMVTFRSWRFSVSNKSGAATRHLIGWVTWFWKTTFYSGVNAGIFTFDRAILAIAFIETGWTTGKNLIRRSAHKCNITQHII